MLAQLGAEAAVGVVGGNAPREDGMAEGTDAPDDAVALDDAGDAGERLCAEEWMNIFSSLTLDC